MPLVPIEIPSETVGAPNKIPLPPAASTPVTAVSARSLICILQGVSWLPVETTPIWDLLKSSSLKPTARSMARLGARSAPSTTGAEKRRFAELGWVSLAMV